MQWLSSRIWTRIAVLISYDDNNYTTLFSKELMFLSYVRDGWRDKHKEKSSSSHIFFQEPGDANTCSPLQARQRRLWSAAYPSLACVSLLLSKSDRVFLITSSPSGYTPVVHDCPDRVIIFLFTDQNVTACQSARAH